MELLLDDIESFDRGTKELDGRVAARKLARSLLENKYTIIANGGIGKHIIATTLLRHIKESEPKSRINVISGYPEVFLHNPHIYRNLHHMTSYAYDDYIKGTDFRVGEPYSQKGYYDDMQHLSTLFPRAFGFKDVVGGDTKYDIYPEIYLASQEIAQAKELCSKSPKPIITVQVTGGNQQLNQMKDPKELTCRDLLPEVSQKIVDIATELGFNVIHVRLPHERQLNNVMFFNNIPFRKYMALIPNISGHIGIDSAMMHAVAAFKKPGLIFWGNTNVQNLGYPCMTNVNRIDCPTPMCARPHCGMPDQVPEGAWICPENKVCQKWSIEEVEIHVRKFLTTIKEQNSKIMRIPLSKPATNINTKKREDNKTNAIETNNAVDTTILASAE